MFGLRRSRAQRLLQEAHNCLAQAVRERDLEFAAVLIDEAIRLSVRARQLAPA